MQEETKWVPESTPQIPQNPVPIVNSQPPVPPSVSNANKKNSLPWFLWFLAGCGCLGFVVVPIIIIIAIIAINPLKRINEAQERANQVIVRDVGAAIQICIDSEKAKGVEPTKIYSKEICANSDYLVQNNYYTSGKSVILKMHVNSTNTKICVWTSLDIPSGGQDTKSKLVSWDSESEVVSEVGKGKTTCE